MRTLLRIREILETYGLQYLLSIIASVFIRKLGLYDRLQLTKEKIRMDADNLFEKKVAYGPFKGMLLSDEVWWGKYDLLSKYLGQYEEHVMDEVLSLSKSFDHFIDIGAADGYYAIGVLKGNLFSSSTCFEISPKGQHVINSNADLNGVSGQLSVFGEANVNDISREIKRKGPSLVLCDIEGAEFDLFSLEMLEVLKDCAVIIELHDSFLPQFLERRKQLISNAEKFFDVHYLVRANPNVNNYKELESWNDDERMLAFSEGRPVRMDWVCFLPKK